MGGLPNVPLPRDVVAVGDDKIEVRGLSRAEAMRLRTMKDDLDDVDAFLLAQGAGVTIEEAKAWRETTANDVVDLVVDRIVELSGLSEEASKSDGERADERDG